ncbi:hypothetical protein COLO4_15207 [Corchorus olitorius]|uniref:Uncharacterized protein n=1 Tax=Corchorus olitorius TaxID=93759 RepID=A0A1R3JNW1_9ROSI|nr:hypothetical protein COLO4_15207 [Corchorus olitorius]
MSYCLAFLFMLKFLSSPSLQTLFFPDLALSLSNLAYTVDAFKIPTHHS